MCDRGSILAAGKLFPGPHLYTGASMIALWGIAASMVRSSAPLGGRLSLHIFLHILHYA